MSEKSMSPDFVRIYNYIKDAVHNLNEDTEYDTGSENYAAYAYERLKEIRDLAHEMGLDEQLEPIEELRSPNSPPEEEEEGE